MRSRIKIIGYGLATFLSMFALTLCTTEDFKNNPSIITTHTIADSEKASLRLSEGDSLRIEVFVTEESRCPIGFDCAWGGYVKVTFNFSVIEFIESYKYRTLDAVDLFKYAIGPQHPNHPDKYLFALNGNQYELTLNNVTPYPTVENEGEEKHVEFTLTQH